MQFIGIFILFTSLPHQTVFGIDFDRFLAAAPPSSQGLSTDLTTEGNSNTSIGISGIDSNVTEFRNDSLPGEITNATFTKSDDDQINTTLSTNQPTISSVQSSDSQPSSSGIRTSTLIATSSNESHSPSSSPSELSSRVTNDSATSPTVTEDEEPEGVARGKPNITEPVMNTTTHEAESIYAKALELINDTYTLSILLPIAAGVVFAATILLTIAMCKCLRRGCRRRRLRRKVLPDSVKNLRPSDRARLLAESSDEEF